MFDNIRKVGLASSSHPLLKRINHSRLSNSPEQPNADKWNFDDTPITKHKVLGSGAFGKVFLASIPGNKYIALKVVDQQRIENSAEIYENEYKILKTAIFPFIVEVLGVKADNRKFCIIMEYVQGGELLSHLRKEETFSEFKAKFYASQVVIALCYLHKLHIIYRDLCPENILIDSQGYIKLTDFGLSKQLDKGFNKTSTRCGTLDYFAPEVICGNPYSYAIDWWAFGILIYEMVMGYPPFFDESESVMLKKIISGKVHFPRKLSCEIKTILTSSLNVNPSKRLGKCVIDVLQCKWFATINWVDIFDKKVTPPFIPECSSLCDTKYFN